MVFAHRKGLVGVKIVHRFSKAKVLLHRQHAINVEFKLAHLMGIQWPHTSSAQRCGEQTFAVAQVLEEAMLVSRCWFEKASTGVSCSC
ncbi:MAG: hypothetical protein EBQ71_03875, partial [Betaproteobacteria bacterium]|nr:hypothetical protein [Betaproteobacteria bacterium]